MTGNPRTADDQLGNVRRAALRASVNLSQLVHLSAFRLESTTRNLTPRTGPVPAPERPITRPMAREFSASSEIDG